MLYMARRTKCVFLFAFTTKRCFWKWINVIRIVIFHHQHQNHQQWQYNLLSLPSGGSTCSPQQLRFDTYVTTAANMTPLCVPRRREGMSDFYRVQFKLSNLKSDGSFSKPTLIKYRPITRTFWRASLKTQSYGNVTNEQFQKTSRWKDEYGLLKLAAWDLSVLVASVHGWLHLTVSVLAIYTEQNYKRNTFVFVPTFCELNSKI